MKNTDYYDKIVSRTILKSTDFINGDAYTLFKHKDSLHSHTTAYGLPHVRQVCVCKSHPVSSQFTVDDVCEDARKKTRYSLKLTAAWKDWRAFEHPVRLSINGNTLFDDFLFLENVCSGWPSLYFDIPNNFLIMGNNSIELENKSGENDSLFVERVEIHRMTDVADFTLFFYPEFANAGSFFQVGLHLLDRHDDVTVRTGAEISFVQRNANTFKFKALTETKNAAIEFSDNGRSLSCQINEIYPEHPDPVFVGFDGDDVRHDESGEMDRCLEYLTHTQMGNFIVFRPAPKRNCHDHNHPSATKWAAWFQFCKDNDISYQISHNLVTGKLSPEIYQGENFKGWQLHEPYLIFQPMNRHRLPEYLTQAEQLDQLKSGYVQYLSEKAVNARRNSDDNIFYGDPSLLSAYMRDVDAEGILCEPVSNSALLYGTARGTGKEFGAHIAADWYIGYPHDKHALTRFKILAYLNYAYGGKTLYVESSAFKTNAFSRNDREDEFCVKLRNIIRSFHKFTCHDQRPGRPEVPLALVYGNNDSMFWLPDDRIPEMPDHNNWDSLFWGKWGGTSHNWLWKAAEAWLPVYDYPNQDRKQSLTRMFSGTPYGSVDVVLPDSDLSKYRAVAFTGWNTMTEKIFRNLVNYVKNGGVLFICGAHFNISQTPGGARLFNNGEISELIGCDIVGDGGTVFEKYSIGALANLTAIQKSDFLYEHKSGSGKVYYYNFIDYPHDFRLIKEIKGIMQMIGGEVQKQIPYSLEGDDISFINCNLWNRQKLYLTNINWRKTVNVKLRMYSCERRISLDPGETQLATF